LFCLNRLAQGLQRIRRLKSKWKPYAGLFVLVLPFYRFSMLPSAEAFVHHPLKKY